MKKIFLATMLLVSITCFPVASQVINDNSAMIEDHAIETPVKPEDLPEGIKKVLAKDPYADWVIAAAFHVQDGKMEFYKIELVKEKEMQTVNFNKDGKLLK